MKPTTKARHLAGRCQKKCDVALWDERKPRRCGDTDTFGCMFFITGGATNHALIMWFTVSCHAKYDRVVEWGARVERRWGLGESAIASTPRPESLEQAKEWARVVAAVDIANE